MKNFGSKWLMLTGLAGLASGSLFGVGCGGGNDNGSGTAGTTGSAGHAGTTGAAGHAGTTGTAGSTAGTTGSAGRGGTTGTAGSTAGTTGTAGTGGASGAGGSAGANGGLPCPGLNTFDSTVEGFALNTYAASGNLANLEGGSPATIGWTNEDGNPVAGALKINAPFSDYGQFVDAQHGLGSSNLKNWTGYKMHVRVKVASGLNPSAMNPAGIQPYVNTGTSYNYCGPWNNLVAGNGWNDYVLDLSGCTGIDPSMIIAYGVSIQTGSGVNGDAGVNPQKPTAAVIYIDSFWLEGSCGGTGGTGGGGAGGTGTGGAAGAAGSTGTGGAAGASGTTGSGGSSGTTGSGGSSGTTGSGGAAGSNTDGGTTNAALWYTFDTTKQGWALGTSGTGNIASVEGGTPPALSWDSAVGDPNNGSLKVTGTFTNYNQLLQVNSGIISPALDLTGKTVHVWVRLDSGGAGTGFSGGVQLQFLSTPGAYNFGQNNSQYVTLTAGTWTEITADMTAVHSMYASFDPSQVIQVQVQFVTGGQPEGGTFTTTTPVFHIDTVTDGSSAGPASPLSHTFDTSSMGYALSTSITTPDGGTAPTLSFDSTAGSPNNGSLKAVATFTGYGQNVNIQVNLAPSIDLTGKTIHAKFMLDSGSIPSGYVTLHASSVGYIWGDNGGQGVPAAGSWVDLTPLNIGSVAAAGFDKTQIIQVGVQIGTGSAPEGGTFPTPTAATLHIDTIVAQ